MALCARLGAGLQLLPLIWWNIAHLALLAQLQCTDIGCNCPSIASSNLLSMARHSAKPVRYHIEEMPYRGLTQPVDMEGRRLSKTTLNYHAVACSELVMA